MKATPQQVEQVYFLMQKETPKLYHLRKLTGFDRDTIKEALRLIREAEQQFFKAQEQSEKMDRLITFQRPIREQERGKSKGQVGASTNDRSPTPSGMPLYPFLAILTEKHTFTSHTLPAAQWVEQER